MKKSIISFLLTNLFVFSVFAEETKIPKIVVSGTSAKLYAELQDVPGSLSVLNEDSLSTESYFQEQIIQIPNLNYSSGSNRPRFLQVRGIGELEQYEGAPNSSVAVIVDDVDLTGIGAALKLFDISQLEVHRGPQAVRFGSSALAGALFLKTAEASEETGSYFRTTIGNDELFNTGAAGSFQLTPRLNLRLASEAHSQNGFRDNDFFQSDDTNERNEYLGRLKLAFQATEATNIALNFSATKLDNGYDAFSITNGFHTQSDRPGDDVEDLFVTSLKVESQLSEQTLFDSVSSYYHWRQDYSFDGDWGNNPFWAPFDPYDFFSDSNRKRSAIAQAFRLSTTINDIESLFGLYFQSLREETVTREFADNFEYDFLSSDYQAQTYALFNNSIIPLSDNLKLSIGARGEYRDSDYEDSRNAVFTPSDLMWGGQASLQYEQSSDNQWYLLASRGFRGGGFNPGLSVANERREFDSESLINLEIGNHASFYEGKINTSYSAFVNFRNNQQQKLALQEDPNDPLSFTFLTDNAVEGKSYGLESEIEFVPSHNFILKASGALLNTEISSVDENLMRLEGRSAAHAPDWQYSLLGEYFFNSNWSVELGFTGRDAFFFDDSHDQKSSVYHLLNAALKYETGNLQFRLWGRNLTNKRYATRGFFFGNEPPDFPEETYVQRGDPLSFGLTCIYRFE